VLSAIAGAKNLPWRPANAGLAFESTNHLAEVIQLWRRRGVTASHWSRKCPARFEITAIAAIIGLYPRRRDAALPVGLAKRHEGALPPHSRQIAARRSSRLEPVGLQQGVPGVEPATGSCPVREARHDLVFLSVLCSFARKQGFSARARLLSAGRIACAIDIDRCGLVVPASAM
jgi:hypothetical protein